MDKTPSNSSSIELFRNYPQLVLLLSSAGLAFMTITRTLLRTSDAGIMMAVGGNRIGTIRLLVSELWILHGIGFSLSMLATVFFLLGWRKGRVYSIMEKRFSFVFSLSPESGRFYP